MASSTNKTLAEVNKEWDEMLEQYAAWRQEYEAKVNAKNAVINSSNDADKKKESSPRGQRKNDPKKTKAEVGRIPITTMDTADEDLLPPPQIALWVCKQRLDTSKSRLLTPDKEKRFQDVDGVPRKSADNNSGFLVSTDNSLKYDLKLAKLRHFKERFGHVNVPIRWREEKQLGKWCSEQRYIYRHNDPPLNPKKTAALNALGFVWFKPPSNKTEFSKDPSHPLASFQHVNKKRKETKKKEKVVADKHLARNSQPKAAPIPIYSQQQLQQMRQQDAADLPGQPHRTRPFWEICTSFPAESLPHPQQHQQPIAAGLQSYAQEHPSTSTSACDSMDAVTLMAKDKVSWYGYYSKARAYFQVHGHCSIPPGLLEDDSLCVWINVQKHVLGSSQERPDLLDLMLDQRQLAALEEIGIVKPTPPKYPMQNLTQESKIQQPQFGNTNNSCTELLESSLSNENTSGNAIQETNGQQIDENNSDSDDEPYFVI